jgi:NitT/TauT family transport system substrate-binding protein
MKIRECTILFIAAIILAACAGQGGTTLELVTVQLKWTHQAQFAGFYAADQNGYYAEEGLAVDFVEGGPDVDILEQVQGGAAQFGVSDAAQLVLARAEGQPLRAIAVIYRRNPLVFISLKEAGITAPKDIAGSTVRLTPEVAPAFHTMMARADISPDQYEEFSLGNDLEAFATGEPAVWGVYANGFGLTVERAGYQVNKIYPDDYGVHFYADTLFASDDLIAVNPDLAARVVRATLRGWTYSVEQPGEVGAMVARYDPDSDLELENAKMDASLQLVYTGESHIGWMTPGVWLEMECTMREQGLLDKPLDISQVYTMQFLEPIYGGAQ